MASRWPLTLAMLWLWHFATAAMLRTGTTWKPCIASAFHAMPCDVGPTWCLRLQINPER